MGSAKQINVKNRTDLFFNDMISIKYLNPDLTKNRKTTDKNKDVLIKTQNFGMELKI